MRTLTDPAKIKALAAFNAAADHFDNPALSFWERFGNATVDRMQLRPGARVLDVACGSGASALAAARAVGPEGEVIAVDLAENLLELGRRKAAALGLDNIRFEPGDMTDLPYRAGSFDAVICVFGIFFVPDMEGLLRSLGQLLRPDARMSITTWGPRIFAPVNALWWEAVQAERPDLYTGMNPWDRITDVSAVEGLLKRSGLAAIRAEAEYSTHPLRQPDDWWTIVLGSGLRWTADQLGPEAAERVRGRVAQQIAEMGIREIETNVIYASASIGAEL